LTNRNQGIGRGRGDDGDWRVNRVDIRRRGIHSNKGKGRKCRCTENRKGQESVGEGGFKRPGPIEKAAGKKDERPCSKRLNDV